MNELDRFKAVVHFEEPDYWPLITMGGLGYIHQGALAKLHDEGLPESVKEIESWCRYWGQCTFDRVQPLGVGAAGVRSETTVEGGFEFIRYETGALTRQVVNNALAYCMPDFITFHVRDRLTWERYKELTTPTGKRTDLEEDAQRFADRTRPLAISAGGTWGVVRNLMGPEQAALTVFDDPELLREMIDYQTWAFDTFTVPVIERLRPEVIHMWEDFCYNHGMLISPAAFREFCAPFYRRVAEVGRECGADLTIVDSDGKVDEFIDLLVECGINGSWPLEQVCGNDPRDYRQRHPKFILAGGIEKEIANSGNAHRIEPELYPKLPEALKRGGYFPMFDHALQVTAGFDELCRCMTLLHEICGSDLGEFPRRRA